MITFVISIIMVTEKIWTSAAKVVTKASLSFLQKCSESCSLIKLEHFILAGELSSIIPSNHLSDAMPNILTYWKYMQLKSSFSENTFWWQTDWTERFLCTNITFLASCCRKSHETCLKNLTILNITVFCHKWRAFRCDITPYLWR